MTPQACARPLDRQRLAPDDLRRWLVIHPLGRLDPAPFGPEDLVIHCRFENLLPAQIGALAPDTVLAPLIAPQWDILDVARVLVRGGFRGALLAQTRPLPRADLVLGEVRALFPSLALSLLVACG